MFESLAMVMSCVTIVGNFIVVGNVNQGSQLPNIDGANPSFITSLKLKIGEEEEEEDYDKVIARYRFEKLGDDWSENVKMVPVNFKSEHKAMLAHCKLILGDNGRIIAIDPDRFDKLITALRTAVDSAGTLDKEHTSYNGIFDAFRLA